ncbi:MAG: hypothetical protein KBD06_05010 [Candidatus Pacebacteria bacterium]|nr:hypothetical protein [Candidatus Paceibacterota bacterium]
MTARTAVKYPLTLRAVTERSDPLAAIITDRSRPLTREVVEGALSRSVFAWAGRTPQPGLDESGNVIHAGDLDFASFFVPLALRRAVIEIRDYQNRRPLVLKTGMRQIGTTSFGQIKRLVSNKDVFSFSIHIRDQSIAMEREGVEELGYPMNYMVVDLDGNWYEGCQTLHFKPNAAENAFLRERDLLIDDAISFKYFVHPNRFQSIFGAPYLLLKLLVERMDDEATYYREEVKRLADKGVFPIKGQTDEHEATGPKKKVIVPTLVAELDYPDFAGRVNDYGLPGGDTVTRAQAAYDRRKLIIYTWKPLAQFVIRADELAYFRYGLPSDKRPAWATELAIEPFRKKGDRNSWMRIPFPDGYALRFRSFDSTEHVAA